MMQLFFTFPLMMHLVASVLCWLAWLSSYMMAQGDLSRAMQPSMVLCLLSGTLAT
jgi:hypothetical protein